MGYLDETVVGVSRVVIFTTVYISASLAAFVAWAVVFDFISQYIVLGTPMYAVQLGLGGEVFGVPIVYPVVLTAISVGGLFVALYPSLFR